MEHLTRTDPIVTPSSSRSPRDGPDLPIDRWPAPHREKAAENGRVDEDGLVHLVASPEHMLVMVCGGLGNLHALALHSFGPTRAVTRPF